MSYPDALEGGLSEDDKKENTSGKPASKTKFDAEQADRKKERENFIELFKGQKAATSNELEYFKDVLANVDHYLTWKELYQLVMAGLINIFRLKEAPQTAFMLSGWFAEPESQQTQFPEEILEKLHQLKVYDELTCKKVPLPNYKWYQNKEAKKFIEKYFTEKFKIQIKPESTQEEIEPQVENEMKNLCGKIAQALLKNKSRSYCFFSSEKIKNGGFWDLIKFAHGYGVFLKRHNPDYGKYTFTIMTAPKESTAKATPAGASVVSNQPEQEPENTTKLIHDMFEETLKERRAKKQGDKKAEEG